MVGKEDTFSSERRFQILKRPDFYIPFKLDNNFCATLI